MILAGLGSPRRAQVMEGGEPLAGDRTRGSRGSFTAAGGRRCTVAGEDFEEPFSGQPDAKPLPAAKCFMRERVF